MNKEILFREKEQWARLSVAIKAAGIIFCAFCFLLGNNPALDLRALIPLAVCPLFILDIYCNIKKGKLQAALEENASEEQTASSLKKKAFPVFSIVWFAALLLISLFIACIP